MTLHKILTGCEEGNRQAWEAFLSNFTPVVLRLCEIYVACDAGEQKRQIWHDTLAALCAHDLARLRGLDHQSEREFVADLRALLLEGALKHLDPVADFAESPGPTSDTVKALLKGLPLAHQVVLFLKLAGYSDRTLESVLRITPAVANSRSDW